ncbi:SMC family ATPase [Empedobacter stercoris]|uniref:SMC family ATPase n=1 Tax=Empedobacter stercoris TaxID=1628248 RepID=A0ABX1WP03_9FLAO|nr:SMC family ATPase [Empedobacter stercoris]MCA4809413.1 SMC family ATPase [Empedobacter stercoris]NOJ76428.1 SMC family ATPase [Empedobacter stercoris]QNT14555.1 SMC family ATPase [Empedobacter stercoris]
MIPVKLTIEGLYSYQERQTIDFSNLTEAGLFGIFGNVGSGKSSILEAIMYVLYGETERLNSKDKRAYNMMNLKSNLAYIEFDFYNFEQKLFRATREFKRNSKRFEDVKSPTVVFYEHKEGEWIPLNHSKAEEIIGLSYENFKRTIIIPQGQFKEFIELGAKDRTQMMKEIFGLHRYDLQDKVSSLNAKNLTNLNQLEGKLSGFEEISEEKIKELEQNLIEQTNLNNQVQDEYHHINESFQRLKVLKSDFENLKQKKIDFEKVTAQKVEMDQRKVEMDHFELIFNAFHQVLERQNQVEKQLVEKSNSVEAQQKQLALIENQIKEVSTQLDLIKSNYEALPTKRKEESDLELIVQILAFSQEIEKLKERTAKGLKEVEEVQQRAQKIEESIKLSEKELKTFSAKKIDSKTLIEVENWFVHHQNLDQSIEKQHLKIESQHQQINSFEFQLKEQNIDISTSENWFNSTFDQLELTKKSLEKQKNDIEVQQKLAHYAHNLHDGEACPLCGALEHPNIVEVDDVTSKLSAVNTKLSQLDDEVKALQKKQNEVQKIVDQKQFIEKQIAQENQVLNELKIQQEKHLNLFNWKDFDPKNRTSFEEKKKAAILLEQTITDKNNELDKLRESLEKERQNLTKYKQFLEKFRVEEAEKASQIKQNKLNLKVLKFDDFQQQSNETVQQDLIDLKSKNIKVEHDYQQFTENLNTLNLKLVSQKTSIELIDKQIIELNEELKQHQHQIDKALEVHQLQSIEVVKQVLNQQLNVVQIRKELEDFRILFETLRSSIQELEQKLAEVSFDEMVFKTQEEQLNLITKQLKETAEIVTKTKTEIERLTKSYAEKKDLLIELEKLQKRATNLQTMRNLFNSAGFVQYVSSIYLKQLCDNANVRFHRMTRNQLSLQMNDNNDFEIIDYLNEGRSRSVKTLSGGQSFQVSLSLALALAESVQTNAKSDKNFFFIDEGFGTQDADAVNIVFETLMSLQKENRIVGIISHVDELKDRIPVALQITKDEEKGSLIEVIS